MRGFEMGGFHLQASNGSPTEACLVLVANTRAGTQVFDNLSNIRFTLEGSHGPANTREAQAAPPPATSQVKKGALPSKAAMLGMQRAAQQQKAQQGPHKRSDEAPVEQSRDDAAAGQYAVERPGSLYAYEWIMFDSELEAAEEEAMHPFLAATPAMRRAQRDAYAAAAARKAKEGHYLREAGAAGAAAHPHMQHSRNSSSSTSAAALQQQSQWDELRREYLWPEGQGVLESMFTPYESEGIYMCPKCQPDV